MSGSRDVTWARLDLSLMSDPKVVALARAQRDPARTAATLALYVAAVLASWREDRPISVADAAPAWWLDDVGPYVADLRSAKLVDRTGKVPVRTLDRWMETVRAQRLAGRKTAARRWGPDSLLVASVKQADAERKRERKKERSNGTLDPTSSRASRAGARGGQPAALADVLIAAGMDPGIIDKEKTT